MPPRRIVDQLNEGTDPEDDNEEVVVAGLEDNEELDDDPEVQKGDEGEGDEDDGETLVGDEDDEPPVRQARTPGRRDRDVGTLRSEKRAAVQRARDLEIENARLRAGGGNQYQPESEAVRNARMAAMEPAERMEFLLNEERQTRRAERAEDRFREADARDRDLFRQTAKTNPRFKKYESEVEHRLSLLRAQGQNVPRESILKFILGERVLGNSETPRGKQQRTAARERVERETVTLPKGKGERGSRGGSKSADLEKRLANVPI